MITFIDREREQLYKFVAKWGLNDRRTLRQSERLDQIINDLMREGDFPQAKSK